MIDDTLDRPDVTTARWIATIYYRARSGLIDVQHDMMELEELHDLVEAGPHWDTIEKIDVRRTDGAERRLTIEEAERL